MTELISLLKALLNDGTVKIDVTIRVSIEDKKIKADPLLHRVKCDKCGKWENAYYDAASAARGLRSHRNHCTANGQHYSWLHDQKSADDDD